MPGVGSGGGPSTVASPRPARSVISCSRSADEASGSRTTEDFASVTSPSAGWKGRSSIFGRRRRAATGTRSSSIYLRASRRIDLTRSRLTTSPRWCVSSVAMAWRSRRS